mgnify:FL=1|jgi:hypothetical protein
MKQVIMMFLLMVSTLLSVEVQTMSIDSLSEVKQNHNPKLTSLIAPTILITPILDKELLFCASKQF